MNISTYKEQKAKASIFGKIGIFSASLLTAASAVYIYSPVIGSHADESVTSKVSATINPVASVTLDTSDISFTFTPTASGVFESKPINATVDTNSTGGYELYFSSEDNETNMVNPLASDVIASDFTGTVTSSSMAANKWGYSLNNTDFSKIPALNAQATLKNIDHYPTTAEKTTTVNIGLKVDTNLPSGTYTKNVVFSAIAHASVVPTLSDITYMQDMTPEIAENTPVDTIKTLTDRRDNNTYTVRKLKDGNVWMTENLRIVDKTITSADSNLPSGESWTIPASNISTFTTAYNTNAAYLDSYYGGYYNFYTATAGWGTESVRSGNAPKDICPKGWRLPTGGDSGEFQILYNNYNSNALMRGDPGFVLSGYVENGSVGNQESRGVYWSSTVYNNYTAAYYLLLNPSDVYLSYYTNYYRGTSVRCVAQ